MKLHAGINKILKYLSRKQYNRHPCIAIFEGKDYIQLDLIDVEQDEYTSLYSLVEHRNHINYLDNEELEDDFYREEIVYRFMRETNAQGLPVYLIVDHSQLRVEYIEMPQLSPDELAKALPWEIAEYTSGYLWHYRLSETDRGINCTLELYSEEQYELWKCALAEEKLILDVVISYDIDMAPQSDEQILIDEHGIPADCTQLSEGIDMVNILEILYQRGLEGQDFLRKSSRLGYMPWKDIRRWSMITMCIIFSVSYVFMGVNYYINYSKINNLDEILSNHQAEFSQMDTYEHNQVLLNEYAKITKKLEINNIRPDKLIADMSQAVVPNLIVTNMHVDAKDFFIQGQSKNYRAILDYQQRLGKQEDFPKIVVQNVQHENSQYVFRLVQPTNTKEDNQSDTAQ